MKTSLLILVCVVCLCQVAWAQPPMIVETPVRENPGLTPEQQEALRKAYNLPPGAKLEIVIENTRGGREVTHDEGTGTGPGARLKGTELKSDFNAGAPEVSLGGGRTATGGSTASTMSGMATIVPSEAGKLGILAVGVLVVLAGGVLFYLGIRGAAVIAFVVGGALITAAFYPAVLLWVLLVGLAILVGKWLYSEYKNDQNREALRAVAAGVDDPSVPPEASEAVKKAIGGHASKRDKSVISAVKSSDNITSQTANPAAELMKKLEARLDSFRNPAPAAAAAPSVVVVGVPNVAGGQPGVAGPAVSGGPA